MTKKIFVILIILMFKITSLFAFIEVINLGTIEFKGKTSWQNKTEIEKLNYLQLKTKILSVLKANKITSKVRTGLIESNWYNYNNKASKLFITILADENYIRIQLQQKKLDESIKGNIDPYKIKGELEKVFKK